MYVERPVFGVWIAQRIMPETFEVSRGRPFSALGKRGMVSLAGYEAEEVRVGVPWGWYMTEEPEAHALRGPESDVLFEKYTKWWNLQYKLLEFTAGTDEAARTAAIRYMETLLAWSPHRQKKLWENVDSDIAKMQEMVDVIYGAPGAIPETRR